MSALTRVALASMMLGAPALPAAASTLPELALKKGQTNLALGILDASYDMALSDQLQVGASIGGAGGWGFGGAFALTGRATYRVTEVAPQMPLGITAGAGVGLGGLYFTAGPTLRAPLPIPLQKGQSVILRAAVDLVYAPGALGLYPQPAVELAWRYSKSEEWTLGGNSFIGWRRVL
ncbi:MAG: hypothetical protein VKQ33_11215 [Candidatus Sericytochromatia bacterium]|nr:hypothetical protein [Candidatus Sericytochromatia bacterium]